MATTLEAADRMIAAAAEADIVLLPAHNVRFLPPFVAGAGRRCARVRSAPSPACAPRSAIAVRSTGRRRRRGSASAAQSGGGALIDLGVHVADLLRFVLGDEVESVACTLHHDGRVDDDAQILARFRGGPIGTVHASWIARPGPDHVLTVFGTEGTLHLDVAHTADPLRGGRFAAGAGARCPRSCRTRTPSSCTRSPGRRRRSPPRTDAPRWPSWWPRTGPRRTDASWTSRERAPRRLRQRGHHSRGTRLPGRVRGALGAGRRRARRPRGAGDGDRPGRAGAGA